MDNNYYLLWGIFVLFCLVGLFVLVDISVSLHALVDILTKVLDKQK